MLEIHLSDLLFTILNLLVLYAFLRKVLFGRVNAVLEQRAALVQETITAAQAQNREAEERKAQYEEQLTNARQEAAQIVTAAQTRAQRAYEDTVAQAQEDARRLRREAEDQIASEREAMLRGARNEVASLALLAAAKVAEKELDGAEDQALVRAFLSEVGEGA